MQNTRTNGRQSKEAQRNEQVQAVWMSLRFEGQTRGNVLHEYWTCASQSEPGMRYTITHDLVSGRTVCNCTAGQYGRDCKHQSAVRRYLASRAANIQKQAAFQATWAAEQAARDTAPLRRNNSAFSMMK